MAQKEVELILLRQWASYMAMPVWIAGSDETLLYFNEPAEALLGQRFDEAPKLVLDALPAMFKITTEDGSPLPLDKFPPAIALRERQPAHRRLRFRALDGVWRTVEVTAFPVEGHARRHLGAVAIFWEVDSK